MVSGKVLLRLILIRSAKTVTALNAQHAPQYVGMCWFFDIVRKLIPFMSSQFNSFGSSDKCFNLG